MSVDPSKTSPLLLHLVTRFGMMYVFASDAPGSSRIVRGRFRPDEADPKKRYDWDDPNVRPQILGEGSPHGGTTNVADEGLFLARHRSNPLRLPERLRSMSDEELIPDLELFKRDTSWMGASPTTMAHGFIWRLHKKVIGALVLTLTPRRPTAGTSATLSIANLEGIDTAMVHEMWMVGDRRFLRKETVTSSPQMTVDIPADAREGYIYTLPVDGDAALGGDTGDITVLPPGDHEEPPEEPDPPFEPPKDPPKTPPPVAGQTPPMARVDELLSMNVVELGETLLARLVEIYRSVTK